MSSPSPRLLATPWPRGTPVSTAAFTPSVTAEDGFPVMTP